jgi:hypothetical protein
VAKKDKCQPLKFENSVEGTEDDFKPTEIDPSEDFVNSKGIVFEGEDETFIRGESTIMEFKDQDTNNSETIFSLFNLRNAITNAFSAAGWVSTNVRDAIVESYNKAVNDVDGKGRYIKQLTHNGAVADGTFFGVTENIPGNSTPISFPRDCVLEELVFSNNLSTADFTLYLRKGSITATPFATYSRTNTLTFSEVSINESITAGTILYVEYQDDGINSRDVFIDLYIRNA